MQIVVLGINHQTASLETREKIAFADKHTQEAYRYLAGSGVVTESVILSTCNRTEIYACVEAAEAGQEALVDLLEVNRGVDYREIEDSLYFYKDLTAVSHLLKVTAGLNSMILGETQIQGQVREAYERAVEADAVGKALHGLFKQAAKCAKRVQTETKINHNSVSISYLAVEMLKKELGSFEQMAALVIGAGKMSRLTLQHLFEAGAKDIRVTSRTYERAKDLAHLFKGRTVDFSRKEKTLPAIDIIITSTGAPHLILRREDLEKVMAKRGYRPLFIIDIAVPRDVEASVREVKNVYLFDMDSLQAVVAENRKEREKEASLAGNMVAEEAEEFQSWFKTLGIAPAIKALRRKADRIRQAETKKFLEGKLGRLSEKEKQAVESLTCSVMNAMLKEPILNMKSTAVRETEDFHLNCLLYLFNLQQEFDQSGQAVSGRGEANPECAEANYRDSRKEEETGGR